MTAFSARALSPTHPRPLKVLIPLFPDFNTFDANGPIEVLSQASRNSRTPDHPIFQLTIAASAALTRSVEGIPIARDISLADAASRVEEWDVVLLPGGVRNTILGLVEGHLEGGSGGVRSELCGFLQRYRGVGDGLTLSVCTGSLFLAAVGALDGRTATSHWVALGELRSICEENGSNTKIVRARWVDSDEPGLPRVITAGGVACGIDATFYLVELVAGKELVDRVAKFMDYQRRGEEVQGDYVATDGK